MRPSSAVVAAPEPASVANSVPPPTAIRLSRPGTRPSQTSSTSISRAARPERNSNSPISRNSGTGMIEKLATESITASTIWLRPATPPQKNQAPAMLTARNAKAIGMPITIRAHSAPTMMVNATHHSMQTTRWTALSCSRRTRSRPLATASAHTINSCRKRSASSAQPTGMMISTIQVGISSVVGLNACRVNAIQVEVAPNTVSTTATASEIRLLVSAQMRCQNAGIACTATSMSIWAPRGTAQDAPRKVT